MPQYITLNHASKNWWEPAAHQTSNFLYQLVLAKAAQNARLEIADRELESRKQELKYRTEQDKIKAKSEAAISGVKVNPEATGETGEVFDEYLGGYVVPPKPTLVTYEGKKYLLHGKNLHPLKDDKEMRPEVKTYTGPAGEIKTFDVTKEEIPPGWYPTSLDKRFRSTGNEPQAHWQRKTRIIAGPGERKLVQDYDFNPVTREEKLVGQPYEAPKGFSFLEQLITGNLPGMGAPPQGQPQRQASGMTPEELAELEELRRKMGR